MFTLFSIFIAS